MGSRLSRRTASLLVCALTAFALAIRLVAIDARLPHTSLGDERYYAGFLDLIETARPDAERGYYYGFYPQLVPRLALWFRSAAHGVLQTLADHLAHAASDVVLLRRIVACLAVLIVPATYRIARRFLDRPAALLAAGLGATSLLSVWYSPQARPHAALAGLTAVALYGALEVRRRGDLRTWTWAGLGAAAAIGTLHNGFFVLGALLVAHGLPGRARARGAHLLPLVAVLLVAASVRAFYPFLFVQRDAGEASDPPGLFVLPPGHVMASMTGSGFARSLHALWNYDPALTACAGLALAWCCARVGRRRAQGLRAALATQRGGDAAVLAGFALPLIVTFGLFEYTHQRYLLPLLPLLACASARGLEQACELVRPRRSGGLDPRRLFRPAAIVLFALQALLALAIVRVRAADDTAERAAAWVAAHVDRARERVLALPGLELPLIRDEQGSSGLEYFGDLVEHPWPRYQSRLAPPARARLGWPISTLPVADDHRIRIVQDFDRYLDGLAAEYVVIEVYEPGRNRLFALIRARLRARGEPLARISPWRCAPADDRPYIGNDDDDPRLIAGNWAWHALRASSLGPVIEIYRGAGHDPVH